VNILFSAVSRIFGFRGTGRRLRQRR